MPLGVLLGVLGEYSVCRYEGHIPNGALKVRRKSWAQKYYWPDTIELLQALRPMKSWRILMGDSDRDSHFGEITGQELVCECLPSKGGFPVLYSSRVQ